MPNGLGTGQKGVQHGRTAVNLVKRGLEMGIITFFFLHTKTAIRISPPLIISMQEIRTATQIILDILDEK